MHKPSVHNDAWDLLTTLNPDIALVQEAVVPDRVIREYGQPPFTQPWPRKPWGSAIKANSAPSDMEEKKSRFASSFLETGQMEEEEAHS